ncbi:MAG: hypothetical protein IJJ14_05315 [Coriobacteriales bacterium]|nr:hypothetical protein [Coriobacteriales bacterium]
MGTSSCKVKIQPNQHGMQTFFLSEDMYNAVEEKAAALAEKKTKRAKKYLQGKEPTSGLFGYHMKAGRYTWMAVVFPKNRAAYAIGRKHGIKKL